MLAKQLRCEEERSRFVISAVVSGLFWFFFTLSTFGIGLLYVALFAPVALIVHALLLAHVRGNGVRVNEQQLPHLYEKVVRASRILGLEQVPEVYVSESGGLLNAFATKLLRRRFVILYSNLLDACEAAAESAGETANSQTAVSEIDFIIGHELGHIGAGHLSWNTFLLPAMLMPWLGPAYSRAREYTCDACGYAVVENLTVASRALALLAAGGRNAGRMNLDAFVEQRREAAGFWMSVYELNSTHPFLSKRVAALRNRLQPGTAKAEPRGVMAYLTAPMWGIYAPGGGGPMIAIFMILGIVFALGAARGMSKFPGFSQFAAANARAHAVQPDAEEAVGEDGVEGSDGEESESDTQEPARR